MTHVVSVLLSSLDFFDPDNGNLALHGANLSTGHLVRRFARHPGVSKMEVFLPPSIMVQTGLQAKAAQQALPPELRGKGRLSFYPIHSLPNVWSDGNPRVLFCVDIECIARDRYLRDRFAIGPMPVTADIHALGFHKNWQTLARFAAAKPVEYDAIGCLSTAARTAVRNIIEGFVGSGPSCRLEHLPRGVDTEIFHPYDPSMRREARRILSLPEDATIAMFLGRVTPFGKCDLLPLVRAFANASTKESDVLLIAGEEYPAGYGEKLRAAGNEVGLKQRLIIHGRVAPAMRPMYYGASDIFVFPSDTIQETMGVTGLEAMAAGLPTVISDWSGMRDFSVDGETGYMVPTRWIPGLDQMDAMSPAMPLSEELFYTAQRVWIDWNRMTDALKALLSSAERRAQMGQAGRARILASYTWEHAIDKWVRMWDELAPIAAAEAAADRDLRRAGAQSLGLPTPYDRLFSHYATSVVDTDRDFVRLTAHGRAICEQRGLLKLFDDLTPIVHNDVFDALFDALAQESGNWKPIGPLIMYVSTTTGKEASTVLVHICLLLKREALELERASQEGRSLLPV